MAVTFSPENDPNGDMNKLRHKHMKKRTQNLFEKTHMKSSITDIQ